MIKTIEFSDGTVWTGTDIARMVQEQGVHGTETDDTISDLSNWYAYDNDATIHGNTGNDTIYGNEGNDVLFGDVGNDTLCGNSDNDILEGGTGDDILYGGEGDDTYVFAQGDGKDKITDTYGNNQISFGEGIDVSNLLISTQNYDISINFEDSDDMLTLVDGLRNDAYKNFELSFLDGTVGTIDLSDGTDSMIQIIKEAEKQNQEAEGIVADTVQTDTQVMQIVDAMNTGDEGTISTVESTSTTNTVDETLLFIES